MSYHFFNCLRSGLVFNEPSALEEATNEVVALTCGFVAESPSRFATALGITAITVKLGTGVASLKYLQG
jgi:hypothetical protein